MAIVRPASLRDLAQLSPAAFPAERSRGPTPRRRPRSVRDVIDPSLRHRGSDSILLRRCSCAAHEPQQAYTTQIPYNEQSRSSIVHLPVHASY